LARLLALCCGAGLQLLALRRIVNCKRRLRLPPAPGALAVLEKAALPLGKGVFMNLTISGHHLEVTPPLHEYVKSKLLRVTRYFGVVDVKVLLSVDKNLTQKERRQHAECTMRVKGRDLFAESTHSDMYAAVDELSDKLARLVTGHKEQQQDHHHVAAKRLLT
jgi:putative sigma-54 modulation protein